ncbi:MAG: DegT/DnrJ/EryC1/StrS family aminotransferase [Acidobacteria bacterium]|nr:DegT/DnrJ/EryC1/StrS family aminotransferase [Acidobacteriota bacterium]
MSSLSFPIQQTPNFAALTPPHTVAPLFAEKVPLASPTLPPVDAVLVEIRRLLEQSQLTNGETVRHFEEEAADYLGVPECVAVSSCTSGLMLVERLMGLSGEVIVPSFTFFATAHSLLWNGLEPVLVDCDPHTFNLDPQRVEDAIGTHTSAILGVHIFGCPAAVKELEEIAGRHGLRVIYDGAHAFGSEVDGTSVACWGDATVYSLTPTKPLVAGEGGLIATRDRELARRLRQARNYGKGDDYDCRLLGLNARMTEIQAALGRAGLPLVEEGVRRRNELASIYEERLAGLAGLRMQAVGAPLRSSRKDFPVVIDAPSLGFTRDELEGFLGADNIETRRYFDPPLHRQQLYSARHASQGRDLPATDAISANVLCLPLFAGLKTEIVEAIADRIHAIGRSAGPQPYREKDRLG